jgi:cell division inhibitor SepF
MAIWKKAMDYLGLGPDDAYDDYEPAPEPERMPRQPRMAREPEPHRQPRGYAPEHELEGSVRPLPARPSFPSRDPDAGARRPAPPPDDSSVQPRPVNAPRQSPALRISPASPAEPYTVRPRRFDSAQEVADKFKDGQPVIMNLEAADREVSRRLIDFASGLCYALNGSMEKVASGVYLLKPLPPRASGYDSDFA